MLKHSPMGPSSLQARELCPGSRRLIEAIPGRGEDDEDSVDSKRGTKLHDLCAKVWLGKMDDETAKELAGEDWKALAFALNVSRRYWTAWEPLGAGVLIEHEVNLEGIHPAVGFGTLDLAFVLPFDKAFVLDYKFGYGEVPPARKNLQMMAYALGIMDSHGVDEVHAVIVAASKGFVSDYTYVRETLDDGRARIRTIVKNTMVPWARLCPGADQCKYCPAILTCPAVNELAGEIPLESDPVKLRPGDAAKYYSYATVIEAWVKKAKARATALAIAGADIPGYELKQSNGKRVWKETVTREQLLEVAKKLDKDASVVDVIELATPPAVENAWGKSKAVAKELAKLVTKKSGSQQLKPVKE